jgi:hypothetical protein
MFLLTKMLLSLPILLRFPFCHNVFRNQRWHFHPYSKSSLTLNEWRFNLSFSSVSMLFLNSWRVSSHIVRYDTNPPAIQKQHWHSREARIEPPLIECEWAFRIRAFMAGFSVTSAMYLVSYWKKLWRRNSFPFQVNEHLTTLNLSRNQFCEEGGVVLGPSISKLSFSHCSQPATQITWRSNWVKSGPEYGVTIHQYLWI